MKTDTFKINAKTCTLKYNSQGGDTILGNGKKYVIPIYQRPYSWGDEQIRKFISDIFTSYWGVDGSVIIEEEMFIGTMQLSYGLNDETSEQQIIDGQQRLTTFLLMLKTLKGKFPESKELKSLNFNWLRTEVNVEQQQFYLQEAIAHNLGVYHETQNPYLKNVYLLNEILKEYLIEDIENAYLFDIDRFTRYVLGNVYFVVIETKAGLSKTLQIFNAINTTGLDLNGGDIFKLNMYEYLIKRGYGENAFNEISLLYNKIDVNNARLNKEVTNIRGVLGIYQYILIAENNLPGALHSLGVDTFFERLFDTILNNKTWEHFKNNSNNLELSTSAIDKIIDAIYKWENIKYLTAEDACALHFIRWSRYSRYWNLVFVYIYKFSNIEDDIKSLWQFIRQMSKLFIIYSIRYQRLKSDIYYGFMHIVIQALVTSSSPEKAIGLINNKIGNLEDHKGWYDLEEILNGDITHNFTLKNIICRLSAMLEEDYTTSDTLKITNICKIIFETHIDIEHIQSYHDKDEAKRNDIWSSWNYNINSLGNLMILDRHINTSISNSQYEHKIKRYADCTQTIVKRQVEEYPVWNLKYCLDRKEKKVKRILRYLFNDSSAVLVNNINEEILNRI